MTLKDSLSLLIILTLNPVYFSQVYSVGNDDGFAVTCYSQTDNPMSISFSVGNDDGFGMNCYSQAWIFYSVGNGGGGGVSCKGGVGTEVPLPVELISFIAYKQNSLVNLEWKTASEINNDYFTIEKSNTAENWIAVTTIKGAGNSTSILDYKTTDNTPYKGISYYRLKQTDFNGEYKYSSIKVVNFEEHSAEVVIYPNPTKDLITIQANKQEFKSIKINNSLGEDVTNLTQQISKTGDNIVISLGNLANGIYIVRTLTTANKIYKK